MRTCLVTGAGGFVGSAVAAALLKRGDRVVAVGRTRSDRWLPGAVKIEGDVADLRLMRDLISRYEPSEVYHYAAHSIVRSALRDLSGAALTNVFGTAAVLAAVADAQSQARVLIASTDKSYGEQMGVRESDPLRPEHVYDATKAGADLLAQAAARDLGLRVVITRCCNIYGPGDMQFSRLVPATLLALAEGRRPALNAGAAQMEREFIYVQDYVRAALMLVQMLGEPMCIEKGCHYGSAWNVGTGEVFKVGEAIRMICRAAGRPDLQPEQLAGTGAHELRAQSVDTTKLRSIGWAPEWSFERGIAETVRWYDHHFGGGQA
mgnify:CR=1 FL=1